MRRKLRTTISLSRLRSICYLQILFQAKYSLQRETKGRAFFLTIIIGSTSTSFVFSLLTWLATSIVSVGVIDLLSTLMRLRQPSLCVRTSSFLISSVFAGSPPERRIVFVLLPLSKLLTRMTPQLQLISISCPVVKRLLPGGAQCTTSSKQSDRSSFWRSKSSMRMLRTLSSL